MNGIIYARYSSDNQREESIDGQLRECLIRDLLFDDKLIDRLADTFEKVQKSEFPRVQGQ
jgi:hypothetical protein